MIVSHSAMDRRRRNADLEGMYTLSVPRVRDEPAAYGPHEIDDDEFPAARVLEDLARSSDEEVPRVLARYAALRSWILGEEDADPILVGHAAQTARAYLAAVEDWSEAEPLGHLADAEPALGPVHAAAAAAREAGHAESAYALLHAGYMAARRRADLAWAARLADALADLLAAEGMDGAALWTRRATRLRQRLDRG